MVRSLPPPVVRTIADFLCFPLAVTVDYEGANVREGNRVVSLGEKPYLDTSSPSRRTALGLQPWVE